MTNIIPFTRQSKPSAIAVAAIRLVAKQQTPFAITIPAKLADDIRIAAGMFGKTPEAFTIAALEATLAAGVRQ